MKEEENIAPHHHPLMKEEENTAHLRHRLQDIQDLHLGDRLLEIATINRVKESLCIEITTIDKIIVALDHLKRNDTDPMMTKTATIIDRIIKDIIDDSMIRYLL